MSVGRMPSTVSTMKLPRHIGGGMAPMTDVHLLTSQKVLSDQIKSLLGKNFNCVISISSLTFSCSPGAAVTTSAVPVATSSVVSTNVKGAGQEKSVELAPALPCTNQWAKGRPQVIAKKLVTAAIAGQSNFSQHDGSVSVAEQDASLESQTPALVEGESLESSQTDDTLPEELRTREEVGHSKTNLVTDDQSSSDVNSADDRAPVQISSVSGSADVEAAAVAFDNLAVDCVAAQQDPVQHTIQAPTSAVETMSSSQNQAVSAANEIFHSGSAQSHEACNSQAALSQYAIYQNQFQPQQQQFPPMQDTSFNAHKMYYSTAADAGQTSLNFDAANRGMSYPGKGVPAPKQQSQQLNWQSPMMNNYGMMTPNMYMTPQQVYIYMLSFFICFSACCFSDLTQANSYSKVADDVYADIRDGSGLWNECAERTNVQW